VAKREWGAKHTCAECGVKFYDLHRKPIACPRCGSVIEIERVRPSRRRPPPPPAPVVNEDTALADAADESADEDEDSLVEDLGEAQAGRLST